MSGRTCDRMDRRFKLDIRENGQTVGTDLDADREKRCNKGFDLTSNIIFGLKFILKVGVLHLV